MTHFSDGASRRLGHGYIKVSRRLSEHQVPVFVSLPCLDESKVSSDGLLHDVMMICKHTVLYRRNKQYANCSMCSSVYSMHTNCMYMTNSGLIKGGNGLKKGESANRRTKKGLAGHR